MTKVISEAVDHVDDHVDEEIDACIDLENPTSFFLFAGAGSGKTRSLVRALNQSRKKWGSRMRLRGQQIAVITYTNAACDEINRRLDYDPLYSLSTIHSFVWSLIQGFNFDIKAWLEIDLTTELEEIKEAQTKGRKVSQAAVDREQKIVAIQERLANLEGISKFIYSPTGENRTKDSLNHAEVIKIGAAFLEEKPLMQQLLVSKFPVLLIDESQDTNKLLVNAFFKVQAKNQSSFCLGLIGDTMQRIYSDGKVDLGIDLPDDWKKPSKEMNHRCPARVVKLINKIRSEVDSQTQKGRSSSGEGCIRCFLAPSDVSTKLEYEQKARERMAILSGDKDWNTSSQVKTLILEHHMAAQRLGFLEMFEPLDAVGSFKTGLRDGTLPFLGLFSKLVLPLVVAKQNGNEFAVAAIVREQSPLLSKLALSANGVDQKAQVGLAKVGVEALMRNFDGGKQPSFLTILKSIADSQLFTIPNALVPFISRTDSVVEASQIDGEPEEDLSSKRLLAIRSFLDTPFLQVQQYTEYVNDKSPFATHQGVKGLEFPRVAVILDDEGAGGFLFSFEKLFEVKEKTPTDLKNELAGTDTGIDRTRRLLYVTCSRSQSSLALIAYSSNPSKVKETLLKNEWFENEEIEFL